MVTHLSLFVELDFHEGKKQILSSNLSWGPPTMNRLTRYWRLHNYLGWRKWALPQLFIIILWLRPSLKMLVSTPHNTLVIMWGKDKNFQVLMLYERTNWEKKKQAWAELCQAQTQLDHIKLG
jgi:hypothetical protein